jgi:glycerol-3-phosphate dehydrogenase
MQAYIIGNGEFAYALFYLLKKNQHQPIILFRNKLKYQETIKKHKSLLFDEITINQNEVDLLQNIQENKKIAFFAMNSAAISESMQYFQFFDEIVLCCKGFFSSEELFISNHILSKYKNKKISCLYGPGFAKSIVNNEKTILASNSENVINLLQSENITIEHIDHLNTMQFVAAIKNIVVLIFGYLNEKHQQNANEVVFNFYLIFQDITNLALKLNLDNNLFLKSFGIADIILSSFYKSRNFKLGEEIAKNNSNLERKNAVEGYISLTILNKFVKENNLECRHLLQIMQEII